MKTSVYISLLLFVIGLLLGFFLSQFFPSLTGKASLQTPKEQLISQKNYTYTTAICNYQTKECIDVKIVCESGFPVSIIPLSNLVQFDANWQDLRENQKKLCG